MVRITEDLIRKRAEHNECIISTLEEISLHQQDIERIEYLDKWCRDLKILYLQSNLIPKIENVGRLKKLEYLNLALNNVERIENLEGCESLNKLDLTVNFVGELTDIENLRSLYNLRELFLTGNPCAAYEGYKDYVIATLPQLTRLDGIEIDKSERIIGTQNLAEIRGDILRQQQAYRKKREREKEEARQKEGGKGKEKKEGYDGRWYTDINEGDKDKNDVPDVKDEGKTEEENDDEFWNEETSFTPESRIAVHEHMKKTRERDEAKKETKPKPPRKMFTDDGRPLNVNEAKVDFSITEDIESQTWLLDVAVFRHMDTSLCDVDVQTNHVRVTIKGKVLQLELPEEVKPDSSSAQRSQITGHLLISMPKAKPVITASKKPNKPQKESDENTKSNKSGNSKRYETLEVDPSLQQGPDFGSIVSEKSSTSSNQFLSSKQQRALEERPNSKDFVDDPDVPPLI